MEELFYVKDVLVKVENFPWDDSLFLPENKKWSLNSQCAVLNLDDLDDDEESPKFAVDNNLIYVMSIQVVQDIVRNAYEQDSNCSELDLFEAFLYYYNNDAFLF